MMLLNSTVCITMVTESEIRPNIRMSGPVLTAEAQLRYMLQWFGEFSELQREDFLPVLAAARGDKPDQLAATLANLSCQDKPVSLFQCRIKLFNEWYPTWAEEEQDRLIKGVSDMDADFGAKLEDLLINGPQLNGDVNGSDEFHLVQDEPVNEPWRNADEEHEETNGEEQSVSQDSIPVEIVAAS